MKKSEKFLLLRKESRQVLYETGLVSNPGWTDHDIISAVRRKAGLKPVEPWDEWGKNEYKTFRNGLVTTLKEAGVTLEEPPTKVRHVVQGLRTLLVS